MDNSNSYDYAWASELMKLAEFDAPLAILDSSFGEDQELRPKVRVTRALDEAGLILQGLAVRNAGQILLNRDGSALRALGSGRTAAFGTEHVPAHYFAARIADYAEIPLEIATKVWATLSSAILDGYVRYGMLTRVAQQDGNNVVLKVVYNAENDWP